MFRPVETPNREQELEQEKGCRMRMSPNGTYTWIRDTDSDKRRVTYAPLCCYTAHIHILMEYLRRDGILYYTVYPVKLVSSIFYWFSWGSQQWYTNGLCLLKHFNHASKPTAKRKQSNFHGRLVANDRRMAGLFSSVLFSLLYESHQLYSIKCNTASLEESPVTCSLCDCFLCRNTPNAVCIQ